MAQFHTFILLADMRTGSNFLESNLNAFDGLSCHGEAFNPNFIGYPSKERLLGITRPERDADPMVVLEAVRKAPGLAGFRFFHDHDPRVLELCLADPGCAKVILTRNPIDSFVSWKIAQSTGQWKLTNARKARSDQIRFDPVEFEAHMAGLQAFQTRILNSLQRSGQTGFYIAYDDLHDLEVINGLARWLGCPDQLDRIESSLKRQNPKPATEKVLNPEDMAASLARLDRFNLTRTPNFEPRRGPVVPSYVAAAQSPLLFLPLRSGPEAAIEAWLAGLDGAAPGDLQRDFSQKALRDWMQARPGHRAFTVLRHPVARAHAALHERILGQDEAAYPRIARVLANHFAVTRPEPDDTDGLREAFKAFLRFLRQNLVGQTGIRVDAAWTSQAAVIEGFSQFRLPDMLLREEAMEDDLGALAAATGHDEMPHVPHPSDPHQADLAAIYDDEIEALAREVYARDYLTFGFADWQPLPG